MLIVGDVANNYYHKVTDNPNLEIVALQEDIAKIKEDLNITGVPLHHNFISETYTKNNKTYILHNVNAFPPLKKAISQHVLNDNELKVASPTFLCSWAQMKCKFIHKDVLDWERSVKYYENFHKIHKNNLSLRDKFDIKVQGNHLSTIGALSKGITYSTYKYKPFTKFEKNSLFNVFTEHDSPLYTSMITYTGHDNIDILSRDVWGRYDYTDKLDAVVEKATVDACNEYILEDLKTYEETKQDLELIFKRSLMNLCSIETSVWFSKFILKNYSNIVECMEEDFLDILTMSIKSKQLKRL